MTDEIELANFLAVAELWQLENKKKRLQSCFDIAPQTMLFNEAPDQG